MQKGQTLEDQPNKWVRKTLQVGQMIMCLWIRLLLEMQCTCVHLRSTMYLFDQCLSGHFSLTLIVAEVQPHPREGTTPCSIKPVISHHSAFPRRKPCVNESTQLNKCCIINLRMSVLARQVNTTDATAALSSATKQRAVLPKVRCHKVPAGSEMIIICFVCLNSANSWSSVTDRS